MSKAQGFEILMAPQKTLCETSHFLVKGIPSYMGDRHATFSTRWAWNLKTAESIRTGVPQAKIDFSNSSTEQLEAFLRRINASRSQRLARCWRGMIFPQLKLSLT